MMKKTGMKTKKNIYIYKYISEVYKKKKKRRDIFDIKIKNKTMRYFLYKRAGYMAKLTL